MLNNSLKQKPDDNEKIVIKKESKNYLPWVDIMRGSGIILITIHHFGLHIFLGLNVLPIDFLDNIFYYSVIPVFIFLSGYTIYINYNQISSYKTYFRKKFKYIIPNYLIWGFPTSFFFLSFTLSYNFDPILVLIATILSVLTGNIWILYFIFIIIQLYIIYPFILKIIDKLKKPFIFFIIYLLSLLILFIISIYFIDLVSIAKLTIAIPLKYNYNLNLYYLRYFPISMNYLEYLSFFIFGILCAKYKSVISNLKYHKVILALLIPLFIFLYIILSGYHANPLMWAPSSQTNNIQTRFVEYFGWFLNILAQIIYLFILFSFFSKIKFSSNMIEKEKIEKSEIKLKTKKSKFKWVKNNIKLILWKIGLYSAGMYYMHFIILYFVLSFQNRLYYDLNSNLYLLFLIRLLGVLFVLGISYLLVHILSKNIENSRYIVGI